MSLKLNLTKTYAGQEPELFDIVFGGLMFMVVGLGIVLVLTFFVLLPMRIKQRHDYWCHRSRIPVGEDHGNQEPHVL